MTGDSAKAMPQYQSHKKVWALKIAAIEFESDGSATITAKDGSVAPFTVADYKHLFKECIDVSGEADLGYFVRYADGYKSWSPTKAFEDGYTRI